MKKEGNRSYDTRQEMLKHLTERRLLDGYIGLSAGHHNISDVEGTRIWWDYRQGITKAMSAKVGRILAEGVQRGDSYRNIAVDITREINSIGITRAETIAGTEIAWAHHMAMIEGYRRAGVEGVNVQAEWLTAGDDNVCAACKEKSVDRSGKRIIYTLDEIEGLIPLHPFCRCMAIPVVIND